MYVSSGRSHPVHAASTASSPASSPVSAQPQAQQGQGRGARRVTAEQKRHLQAKAAQRSRSRQGQNVGSSSASSLGTAVRSSPSPARDGVELGEEATSAMAVQSLSQNTSNSSSSGRVGGAVRAPKVGPASGKGGQQGTEGRLDIPLEDLSTRGKPLRGFSFERARLSRLAREMGSLSNHGHQQAAHHGLVARSHSLSPHRPRQETSSLMSRRDPRRQSAPISIPSSANRPPTAHRLGTQPEASDGRRPHSRSNPVPIPGLPKRSGSSSDDSPEGGRARSWSSPTPKSLLPASAPPASLVDSAVVSGQPAVVVPAMLVPPERTTIVRRSQQEKDEEEEESSR